MIPAEFVVEVALTREELKAGSEWDRARFSTAFPARSAWREVAIGLLVALAGAGFAVALRLVHESDGGSLAVLLLATYAAGAFAMAAAVRGQEGRWVRAMLDRSDFAREPRRFEIGPDGVRVLGDRAEGQWRWRAFSGVERADGLLCFWSELSRGFVVPVRAFASVAEADRALAYCAERIARARA